MDDSKLGFEEFYMELFDRVSKKIVSRTYIEENSGFVDALTFDLFEKYLEGFTINALSEIVESVFFNVFHFHPATENAEEILDIEKY